MRHNSVWLFLSITLVLSPCYAQDNSSWESLGKSLRIGTRIKVTQKNMAAIEGKLAAFSDEGIAVELKDHDTKTIYRNDVFSVNLSGQRKRHALIGLAVGVAAGAVGGAALSASLGGDSDLSRNEAAILGAVGFGMLGAPLGAAIGAAVPANRTIYRAVRQAQVK